MNLKKQLTMVVDRFFLVIGCILFDPLIQFVFVFLKRDSPVSLFVYYKF